MYKYIKMALFPHEKNKAKTDNTPSLIPLVKARVKYKMQKYPETCIFLKYATDASTFMTLRPL